MRILHILPWITSGGVEKRRLLLARHLDRQRYEQRIVCMEGRESLMEQIRASGVPITVLGGTWGLQDYRTQARLRRIIRDWRPDVVHTAVFEAVYHGVLAARLSKADRSQCRGAQHEQQHLALFPNRRHPNPRTR